MRVAAVAAAACRDLWYPVCAGARAKNSVTRSLHRAGHTLTHTHRGLPVQNAWIWVVGPSALHFAQVVEPGDRIVIDRMSRFARVEGTFDQAVRVV